MKKNGFSDRLKALIDQKKLTLAQVAQATGTTATSVHRWTKGGEIEYENLLALASFLEVNWIWLRYGDEAIHSASGSLASNVAETDLRRDYLDQIMANENRMKTALEMAQIVNWEWNTITGTFNFSANAETEFGCKPETIRSTFAPFADLPLEKLLELFGDQQSYFWDFKLKNTEKGFNWFSSRAKLIVDTQNVPIQIIGVTTNINERKHAEFALERSEYTLRKIIETIPVGLWAADENGVINLANPEVVRIWGGAKYVGLDNYGLYKGTWEKNGEALTKDDWTLARAVKTGEVSEAEVVNIEAFDGANRSIIMYATPLLNNDNEIIGAIEVNQDITEFKLTERELRKSYEELQLIYEQGSFGVLAFNQTGIQRINEHLATLANVQRESVKESPLSSLFDTDTVRQILEVNAEGNAARLDGKLLINIADGVKEKSVNMQLISSVSQDQHLSLILVFT
ncbi:MAG: PAS domain S-box protein [Methylophilus sp.]